MEAGFGVETDARVQRVRAAQYVRMSTDHQKYSTENQSDVITAYADKRGFTLVATYADEGRSGLNIEGRGALQRLINDVRSGSPGFDAILVYDVSRWGRFQDADESAYYEFICREAGITVHYCAEQFENDGSLSATIIKSMKRAMAGEYSRELSTKVFAGQCRLISLGYRQGGAAGYGLRRQIVDEHREPKGQLGRGEHKSLQTDRVILTPGPPDEIETVSRIYRLFVDQGRSEREIATILNAEGIRSDLDKPWTRGTVHQILSNEKYAGHNVYNRVSFKLKQKRVTNPPDMWIRADNAFEPIIDQNLFNGAQRIIEARSRRFSDTELLQMLADLLAKNGELSGLVIDELEEMPSSATYRHRFGSLIRAYQLIGYVPDRDYRYIETNRVLRLMHPNTVAATITKITDVGGDVAIDPTTDLLTINREFTLSVVIVRCTQTAAGSLRWKLRLDAGLKPDITVAVRMNPENAAPRDYYLLPWIDIGHADRLRMAEENGIFLDAYRTDDLAPLYHMTRRFTLRRAA